MPPPVLIAGPTASGKSALALRLAESTGGIVVNADSQQVYADFRVLTARPSPAEEARAPHRLYGHVTLADEYSVGHWLREVEAVLAEARAADRPAIFVGGTGLYFRALTEGLAPIPEIPAAVRAEGATDLERLGLTAFASRLAERDPVTAAALDLGNPRRVLRAWDVWAATGIGLAAWRARTAPPLVPLGTARAVALVPPRTWLHGRCAARFDAMMAAGALDEVRSALRKPPKAGDLKAVGARALAAHLAGTLTFDEAVARAKTETRRYAKRQLTWIRNQMAGWPMLDPADPEALAAFRAA